MLKRLNCGSCGAPLPEVSVLTADVACEYCGEKTVFEEKNEARKEAAVLLRRATLLFENSGKVEDFQEAELLLNEAANLEPKNAQIYLKLLQVQTLSQTEEKLIHAVAPLRNYTSYNKALALADNETKARLEAYAKQVEERLAKEKATTRKNVKRFLLLASVLAVLGGGFAFWRARVEAENSRAAELAEQERIALVQEERQQAIERLNTFTDLREIIDFLEAGQTRAQIREEFDVSEFTWARLGGNLPSLTYDTPSYFRDYRRVRFVAMRGNASSRIVGIVLHSVTYFDGVNFGEKNSVDEIAEFFLEKYGVNVVMQEGLGQINFEVDGVEVRLQGIDVNGGDALFIEVWRG